MNNVTYKKQQETKHTRTHTTTTKEIKEIKINTKYEFVCSGVKDVSKINPDTTLADLGLDSLMSTEIQQTLERDFDLLLSGREIRLLTLNKLKDISSGNKDAVEGEKNHAAGGKNSLPRSPNKFAQHGQVYIHVVRILFVYC
jgi:acyl carrier protein